MTDQISLISAICKSLDKHGVKALTARQYNAVIAAADIVVEAIGRPYRPAVPDMGLAAWRQCDEVGMSSEYLAYVLSRRGRVPNHHPLDAADFGWCVGLLRAEPRLRAEMYRLLTGHGPEWAALAEHWLELEVLYEAKDSRLNDRIGELVGGA